MAVNPTFLCPTSCINAIRKHIHTHTGKQANFTTNISDSSKFSHVTNTPILLIRMPSVDIFLVVTGNLEFG